MPAWWSGRSATSARSTRDRPTPSARRFLPRRRSSRMRPPADPATAGAVDDTVPPAAPAGLGGGAGRGAGVTLAAQAAPLPPPAASVVVLARLLGPRDYGLFAVALRGRRAGRGRPGSRPDHGRDPGSSPHRGPARRAVLGEH